MTIHEIDQLLRQRHPHFRAIDARQVEAMREAIPAYAAAATRAEQSAAAALLQVQAVRDLMEALRAEKRYDVADRIRDALSVGWSGKP